LKKVKKSEIFLENGVFELKMTAGTGGTGYQEVEIR